MKSPVFRQLMQAISIDEFQKIVNQFSGDKYSKCFTTWNHLQVMVYFQYLISSNIRDFVNNANLKFDGFEVVTPAQFIKQWRLTHAI